MILGLLIALIFSSKLSKVNNCLFDLAKKTDYVVQPHAN